MDLRLSERIAARCAFHGSLQVNGNAKSVDGQILPGGGEIVGQDNREPAHEYAEAMAGGSRMVDSPRQLREVIA